MGKIIKCQRGARSKFDDATKRRAVLDYMNGSQTVRAIACHYGVSHTHIGRWVKWYEKEQQHLLTLAAMDESNAVAGGQDQNTKDSDPAIADVKALQEELRLAKVKLACLETLIDVAEQDLGIDIRKKLAPGRPESEASVSS